jgi:hypothetical protein
VTRFRHLPTVGRIIIIAVAFGVFAIAAAACATSYNAIYRLVEVLGLYGAGITKTFPLLVDVAFIVAESAAVLGGIMRAVTGSEDVTKGWPYTTMWLCGLSTIAFNVWHAYLIGGRGDPLTVPRCIVASLPPVLMMVSFQVLIAIVKWVMLHLGRPLNSATAMTPTGAPAPWGAYPQMPSPSTSTNGHPGGELDGASDGATKRAMVDMYLSGLNPEQLQVATGSSVVAALGGAGVTVSPREANRVLEEHQSTLRKAARNGRKR